VTFYFSLIFVTISFWNYLGKYSKTYDTNLIFASVKSNKGCNS